MLGPFLDVEAGRRDYHPHYHCCHPTVAVALMTSKITTQLCTLEDSNPGEAKHLAASM
jgi:hypothetical protein